MALTRLPRPYPPPHHRWRARLRGTVLACAAVLLTAASLPSAAGPTAPAAARTPNGDWPSFQKDLSGSRYNGAERSITPANVADLRLKWSFAFPYVASAIPQGQPTVAGGTVYTGGPDGKLYAINARTGKVRWTFTLASAVPNAAPAVVRNSPVVSGGRIVFGDTKGRLYAVRRATGELLWSTPLDTHPTARMTSSPVVHKGKVFVGLSSSDNVGGIDYACCTFRGHLDAIDITDGSVLWRHYTVPEPQQVGTWPSGAARYEPSGAGVWGSPSVDPRTDTVYVGTGQNYTGTEGESDSLLALNARTGQVRWTRQMTHPDTWRLLCSLPGIPPGYCPSADDGTDLDHDLSSLPNLFTVDGRPLVGIGQKNGVYHVMDARTGEIVWQRLLAVPPPGEPVVHGIWWGTAYDGRRLYVATNRAEPGTLFALDPADGDILWQTPNPADGCTTGGAAAYPGVCFLALASAVSASPGLVYEGSTDGKVRVYRADSGAVVWTYDTLRDFDGVNGLPGRGGAVSGSAGGVVVSDGMLFVRPGHWPVYPGTQGKGLVLLAFGR